MDLKTGEYDDKSMEISFARKILSTPALCAPAVATSAPRSTVILPRPHNTPEIERARKGPRRIALKGNMRLAEIDALRNLMLEYGVYMELLRPEIWRSCACVVTTNTHAEPILSRLSITTTYDKSTSSMTDNSAHFTIQRPSAALQWKWCFMYAPVWRRVFAINWEECVWEGNARFTSKRICGEDLSFDLINRVKELK